VAVVVVDVVVDVFAIVADDTKELFLVDVDVDADVVPRNSRRWSWG